MRKKIVAGNWKMNCDLKEAENLFDEIKKHKPVLSDQREIIICPPNIYLNSLKNKITQEFPALKIGAQNCHQETKGAFTGEVSASMLNSLNLDYVILGHSERRKYFGEDETLLSEKLMTALENNLKVIYCFGEQLSDRKAGLHEEIVKKQLSPIFSLQKNQFKNIVLAYEPVWAIGTGETASPDQAQSMHQFIRNSIKLNFDENLAESISILYGGSCKPNNAQELFSQKDVDGGLIGGASLKANDFIEIFNALS